MDSSSIAQALLKTKAVKLNPEDPFVWASGMHSPIYCDNRMLLSHPTYRDKVVDSFVEYVTSVPWCEGVAGVATGAIARGALVAEQINLPCIYIRSKAKEHGRQNMIEGDLTQANKYVVIEDLISTWGSSLSAVQALRDAWKEVLWLWAIFSYGFDKAKAAFKEQRCPYHILTDYPTLIQQAINMKYVDTSQADSLATWRESPQDRRKG